MIKEMKNENFSEVTDVEKYQLDIERYKKAIEKVFQRFADKGWDEIKIEEVWFETSLPIDIILEVFNSGVYIPPEVNTITYKENAIWQRKNAE